MTALFLNGVYESVIEDIIDAQNAGAKECFLQPYKGQVINMLKDTKLSLESPTRLYMSTTQNLKNVSYIADIVNWEDKRVLSQQRKGQILTQLQKWQPGEINHFSGVNEVGKTAVNLLTLRGVRSCDTFLSTGVLNKKSDGLPLRPRKRAGGWSEVFDIGDIIALPTETESQYRSTLERGVEESVDSSEGQRLERLERASKCPERIQILSVGFRRNPDVIAQTLLRAKGVCERCKKPAPFNRRSDGTPFLEVHHWIHLSNGGEDSLSNSGAICPNCHREVHFG